MNARTSINRRGLLVTALAATAAVTLAACTGGSGTAQAAGDTVVIVTAAQPPSFSYETSVTGYEAAEFNANTGATLVRNPYIAASGSEAAHQDYYTFEPLLAKSYDVSDDKLTYTFHLDTEASSGQGNKLSADDVIFSMQRKYKVKTSVVPFLTAPILTDPDQQVKKIDDATVSITVAKPQYGFTLLALLANVPFNIYDSTVLKEHATADDPYAVKWSEQTGTFGFGAYKLTSYVPGEQMVYEANTGYALGAPKVKRIVQRVVADAGQRANLVTSGDAQIATQLRPADQAGMISAKSAQVFTVPTNSWVFMNMVTTAAPFDNLVVRRALSLAVPYDDIAKNVYKDRMTPFTTMLSDQAPGWSGEGLKAKETNVEEAKKLLAEAGVSTPVKFELTVNNAVPDLQEAAVQIQSAAKAAGFEISVNAVSSAEFQSGLATHAFQAMMQRDWAVVQSPAYVLPLFYTPGSPVDWSDWDYPPMVKAVAAGNAASDPLSADGGKAWNEAEQILASQLPTIYMGDVQPLNAFANGVGGYVFRSDNVIDYSQLSLNG